MSQTFHYGNIYRRGEIDDAAKLEPIIRITDGQQIEFDHVKDVLTNCKREIEAYFKAEIDYALILYPDGKAILDIFIDIDDDSVEENHSPQYSQDIRVPNDLQLLWDEYMAVKKEAILQRKSTGSTADAGHFLSHDQEVRVLEEKFLELVPNYISDLKNVVRNGHDSKMRGVTIYLLQWQPDKQMAADLCLELLEKDSNHGVHNDATRALNALSHKAIIPDNKLSAVFDLIYHPSTACINKGIWLITDLFERDDINIGELRPHLARIEKLSKVKQPNIHEFAKLALEKITTLKQKVARHI